MSKTIAIGKRAQGADVRLDIGRLIESRMLVQANSGGGKSWMLRLLAERIGPHVPIIFLDVEGEFATLRESLDLLIVGRGGEVPAAIPTAGALAIKLLESRVSAVIDLYDLTMQDRRAYIRRFIESLMAAPRSLWSPLVVFVDEAHNLVPQDGQSEAAEAVNALMCQGRKRDFCGILATQRLSKLHKDAAAEANNVLIGRTTLDLDQKRAADVLGMDKSSRMTLRSLPPGAFFAYGPAFSFDGVEQIQSDKVTTTHGRKARGGAPPSPSAAMRKAAAELSDLAERAKTEVIDMEGARARIQDLERQVREAGRTAAKPVTDQASIDRAVAQAVAQRDREWQAAGKELEREAIGYHGRLAKIAGLATVNGAPAFKPPGATKVQPVTAPRPPMTPARPVAPKPVREAGASSDIPKGEAAVLRALIMYPDGLRRDQVTVLTTYKRSTRDAYIQRLGERGYCAVQGDKVLATDEGLAAMPDAEPLPTGQALQDHWMARLPEGEAKILRELIAAWPDAVERDTLTETTGYKRSTRDAYLQRLNAKELVAGDRGSVTASATLFDEVPA